MPAQAAVHGREGQHFRWCELEAGGDQMLARNVLEIMPAREDVAHAGWKCGFAPPIELHLTQAIIANDARAKIGAW
jgi:hypothetical protein